MSDFLTNISITLEYIVGGQLNQGEYRIGIVNLESVLQLQPLNQKFEALVLKCNNCGKNTAFLSMQQLDHYLDIEKNSQLTCRHCQFKMQIPKIQRVRESQGSQIDFLRIQDKQFVKIISKKGRLIKILKQDRKIQLQSIEIGDSNIIEVEIPQTKIKLLTNLPLQQIYRFKAKVFESKVIDPQKAFLKQQVDPSNLPFITSQEYELLTLSKAR